MFSPYISGAIIKLKNCDYLFSFDVLGDKFGTVMFKAKTKMDLQDKEMSNIDVNSEIQKFLWNFGIGVVPVVYKVNLFEVSRLLNNGFIEFTEDFVPRVKTPKLISLEEKLILIIVITSIS
jgi:hypothetical protein